MKKLATILAAVFIAGTAQADQEVPMNDSLAMMTRSIALAKDIFRPAAKVDDLSLPAYDTRPADGEVESLRDWVLSTSNDPARRTTQAMTVVNIAPRFFAAEGMRAYPLTVNEDRNIGCVIITRPLPTEYVRRLMGRFYKEGDVAKLQRMGSDHEAFHCIEAAEPSLQGGGTVYTESRADAYAAIQGFQRGEAEFIGRWADARASRAKEDPDHDTAASIRKVLSDARTKIAMTKEKVIAVIRSATTL